MAKKKPTADSPATKQLADDYYAAMQATKQRHLPLSDAIEVTARQRAEDEERGDTPYLDEAEPEPTPEA